MQEFTDGSFGEIFSMKEFDEKAPHLDPNTAAIWFGKEAELLEKKKALRKSAGLPLKKRDEMKLQFLDAMRKLRENSQTETQTTSEAK